MRGAKLTGMPLPTCKVTGISAGACKHRLTRSARLDVLNLLHLLFALCLFTRQSETRLAKAPYVLSRAQSLCQSRDKACFGSTCLLQCLQHTIVTNHLWAAHNAAHNAAHLLSLCTTLRWHWTSPKANANWWCTWHLNDLPSLGHGDA